MNTRRISTAGAPRLPGRRRLLRNLAAALAAGTAAPMLAPPAVLGRAGTAAPSERVSIGVIGLNSGLGRARVFLTKPAARIAALCDVDARRGTAAVNEIGRLRGDGGPPLYGDFREMFERERLDAALIATPDHWHGLMGVAAARAGLDVFAEAPLARSHAEGAAIIRAVRQHGRVWQCCRRRVSFPVFRRAALLVRAGVLGAVFHVEIGVGDGSATDPDGRVRERVTAAGGGGRPPGWLDYDKWVGPGAWTPYDPRVVAGGWRRVSAYGGGAFAGLCEHYLDFAQGCLGMAFSGPVKVSASAEFEARPPFDAARRLRLDCLYGNGVSLALSSDLPPGVRFFGERGWLHAGRGLAASEDGLLRASEPEILETAGDLDAEAESRRRLAPDEDIWLDFLDCVKTRRRTIATPVQAHRSATIWQLGLAAALAGRPLRWDPAREKFAGDAGDEEAEALMRPSLRRPWQL